MTYGGQFHVQMTRKKIIKSLASFFLTSKRSKKRLCVLGNFSKMAKSEMWFDHSDAKLGHFYNFL